MLPSNFLALGSSKIEVTKLQVFVSPLDCVTG